MNTTASAIVSAALRHDPLPRVVNLVHPQPTAAKNVLEHLKLSISETMGRNLEIISLTDWITAIVKRTKGATPDTIVEIPAMKLPGFFQYLSRGNDTINSSQEYLREIGGIATLSTEKMLWTLPPGDPSAPSRLSTANNPLFTPTEEYCDGLENRRQENVSKGKSEHSVGPDNDKRPETSLKPPGNPKGSFLTPNTIERDLPPLPPSAQSYASKKHTSIFVEGPFEDNPSAMQPVVGPSRIRPKVLSTDRVVPRIPQGWLASSLNGSHSTIKPASTDGKHARFDEDMRERPTSPRKMNIRPKRGVPSLSDRIIRNVSKNTMILTHLEIEPSIGIDTCRLLISRAHVLRNLTVNLGSGMLCDERFYNRSMPTSPLETLTINTTVHPRSLLTTLQLPRLVNLHLGAQRGTFSREDDLGVYELMETSHCHLISLSLLDMYPRESEIVSCLSHDACKRLKMFSVRSSLFPRAPCIDARRYITSTTVGALAKKAGKRPALCPELHRLEITDCDVSAAEFVAMAKTRVGPGMFHLEYSFLNPGPDATEAVNQLNALAMSHPLVFRSTQIQLISEDVDINVRF
ncbi:hypothetical protein H0H87_009367 [Tephrocybe sp. NHM501043]|nr:hypothetical protein H0H87_009367 [Tephrocybe sp. NHM501043]